MYDGKTIREVFDRFIGGAEIRVRRCAESRRELLSLSGKFFMR